MNNEIHTITNPDHVELEFQLAGIGSRFWAGVLDSVCISLSVLLVCLLLVPFQILEMPDIEEPASFISSLKGTLSILVFFLLYWGYHMFWEAGFQGQSPGKKAFQIQVLNDDGLFPSWKQVVIRNILRIVDGVPGFYFVAGAAMGIDSCGKRLGDMAAGTIVIRKEKQEAQNRSILSARSMAQIERGKKGQILTLPFGSIDAKTIELIHRYHIRKAELTKEKRSDIALKIAMPLYEKWGEAAEDPEDFLEMILQIASKEASKAVGEEQTKVKLDLWSTFETNATLLLGKPRQLAKLSPEGIESLMQSYQQILADLARARSMKTDRATVQYLNKLAILGHQLLYQNVETSEKKESSLFFRFPEIVRAHIGPVILSAILVFVPAMIAYCAVLNNPVLGYELVPDEFIDFAPAKADNIHKIPSITRPMAASSIITNNIQVTFLAFALGITAGIGTCYVLISNGVHLGAIAAWMQLHGNAYALWGWIMPHGATEFLAIILSGGAGLVLADAILRPGSLNRREALKKAAKTVVVIELGCIGLLVVAGLIEGFISPSFLTYAPRLGIFGGSILLWAAYFTSVKSIPRTG
jgi:uncharacterized membrane protein SpoIIM required for sporulation/uncharacterized RDD family membrane protein YckC